MVSLPSRIQVIDRAVALVDTVAREGPCVLAELVQATGLPRPTAHRLAVALVHHGVLARDDEGRFVLGARVVAWGARANHGLADAARPVLARLAADSDESAQLYVREGDRRVCVAVHERPTGLRDTVPLGATMPLDRGSGGKVLLAWAEDGSRFTVDARALATIRRRGWAESVGERESGVASVSAPVRGADGGVMAAISVSGPIERLGRHPGRRLGAVVTRAAQTLSGVIAG